MDTDNDQPGRLGTLGGSISVLTRGGPFVVNVSQGTNPILFKTMRLPAEAEYQFKNPINLERNYVNHPVTVELFYGDNGHEGQDISLGVYPIFDNGPSYETGPKTFKITLAVTTAQVLSISIFDEATKKFFGIAYMDISGLESPLPPLEPDRSLIGMTQEDIQAYADNLMKAPPRQARLPRGGNDLSQELTISFEEALHGAAKAMEAASTQPCPVCTGSGVQPGKTLEHCPTCEGVGITRVVHQTKEGPEYRFSTCPDCKANGLINSFPCKKCKGNGWVGATRPITLQIPACIDSGAEICLLHQGEPGRDGGPAGHLRISVDVAAHPLFSRVGRELSIQLPISAGFARQGGHVRVPGIGKGVSYLVALPRGTEDNSRIKAFEGDDYSLTAYIETYRPGFLFALPQVKSRLQAIQECLGGAELEVPPGFSVGQSRSAGEAAPAGPASRTRRSPQQAEFYTRRGMLYAGRSDRDHAMADFTKALEADPACAAAYDRRAAEYGLLKDFKKALADMQKAVDLAPGNGTYLAHKGTILELLNDLDNARIAYDSALELDPACLEAYDRRGRLAAVRGDLKAATADFNRALALSPDNDEIRVTRGLAYEALNEFDKAIADLDIIVNKHPKNPGLYNNRGFIHLKKNDLERALRDYDRALELDPKLLPARIYRGKTLLLLQRFAPAIKDLEQAIAQEPKDPYPLFLLGQAYQGLGERKQAVIAFQRYLDSSQSPKLSREAIHHLAELGIKTP